MAVVAPLLFALILGAIEFGRAVMVTNVLTAACREGARAGVVPRSDNTEVLAAVNSMLTGSGIDASKATKEIRVNGTVADVSTAVGGDQVSVRVTIPYGDVTWLPTTLFISKTSTVGGQAVMRHE
jgi:Flp pilus assembly protein TadG